MRSLGQYLERVPVRPSRRVENVLNELDWNCNVKQIAHRVDEDDARQPPVKRIAQCRVIEKDLPVPAAPLVDDVQVVSSTAGIIAATLGAARDRTEALRHALRIAVRAARTDFAAPGNRIPRQIRPFDPRRLGHAVFSQ